VRVATEGGDGLVVVKDGGKGIAVCDHERVFQRFERGQHPGASGLGLGLYICREIVEAHRGRITLRSAEGEGASFEVRLPMGPGA